MSGERLFHPWPRGDHAARSVLIATLVMVTYGTVMVASASEGQSVANGGSPWSITIHDLVYLGFGLVALYLGGRLRVGALVSRAPLLMGAGLLLLVAVKVGGVSANGGKRWLNLHVIFLQPSELFKLSTIVFVAWAVARHRDELGSGSGLVRWMLPVIAGIGLIVIEPDLGTSSVVFAIALAMLAVADLPRVLLGRTIGLSLLGFGAMMALKPYTAQRFFSFLHPNQNLQGAGYQLLQSKIGLGAGGLTGLGLGHSREKWGLLPNPHTDFIFTIIGEELGLIGTLAVLGLFAWFLWSATRVVQESRHGTNRLIAVGITTWIVLEAVINVASVVGGWAVTGIPLPFFSYGGTALISQLFAVGLLYGIGHDRSSGPDLAIRRTVPGAVRRPAAPAYRDGVRVASPASRATGYGPRSRSRFVR